MKTLTITEAKKNLGHWLRAAVRGEDVGIISGSDVIALRKVEYGVTPQELTAFEKAAETRYRKAKRAGTLVTKTPFQLRKVIEKTTRH